MLLQLETEPLVPYPDGSVSLGILSRVMASQIEGLHVGPLTVKSAYSAGMSMFEDVYYKPKISF